MLPLWWRKVTSGRASATELFFYACASACKQALGSFTSGPKTVIGIGENLENDTGGGM